MRHAGIIIPALLAAATQLPACATTGSPDARKGQSGPVAWEIVDVQQRLEKNGSEMRWDYTLALQNLGDSAIDFERMEIASRAGGSGDLYGGMETTPFTRQLAPRGELKINRSNTLNCRQCAPGHLPRLFSDGIILYYTFYGHDGAGGAVRVPVALRLNSSVGERK
jgi:hypothetical protein